MKPTKQAVYSSRTADKFVVRLPDDMREKIAELARSHHRSMNSQIINWLDICVDMEMAGIPVTRDTLAEAGARLQEADEKPTTTLSFGETVQVPEKYLNDLRDHQRLFGDKPRSIESKTEHVQIFARGRVSTIAIHDGRMMIKVVWLHIQSESDWIPYDAAQRIE